MKAQFDQNVLSSFYLWFENRLLGSSAKAYQINLDNAFTSGSFSDVPDTHIAFQGKYRSLVGEYDVDNPNSGFFLGNDFITGNYDKNGGVFTDYENGTFQVSAFWQTRNRCTASEPLTHEHVFELVIFCVNGVE